LQLVRDCETEPWVLRDRRQCFESRGRYRVAERVTRLQLCNEVILSPDYQGGPAHLRQPRELVLIVRARDADEGVNPRGPLQRALESHLPASARAADRTLPGGAPFHHFVRDSCRSRTAC